MTDARSWVRPTPDEVRAMIERTGLPQPEIAARCDVAERRVRYWIQPGAPDKRRIKYKEWLALRALAGDG